MKQKELIAVIGNGITIFNDTGKPVSRSLDELFEVDWSSLGIVSAQQIVTISELSKLGAWGQIDPFTLEKVKTVKDFIWHVMTFYARRVTREILAAESNPPRAPEDVTFAEQWKDFGVPPDLEGLSQFRARLVERIEEVSGIKAKKFGRPYSQALGAASPQLFLEDITALCKVSSTAGKSSGGGD